MKIVVFDSWKGKFSDPIIKHWASLGHEVLVNPTWDEANKCDLAFFYQADNVFVEATVNNLLPEVKRIYVQCVDIEVWSNQPQTANWDRVNGAIFMADHIQKLVENHIPAGCSRKIIKPGIDCGKWTLRPFTAPSDPVRRIAYVVGDRRIWDVKRLDIAFQLLRDLLDSKPSREWQLHIRGTYSSHEQYNAYCRYLEHDLGLEDAVFWYPDKIDDLNAWLEDKDYFLLPSTKEAFSYATAEAMAKGIKPIINNWQGAKENWNGFVSETYGQMLGEFLHGDYEPEKYRKYVVDNFDEIRYFKELDEFIGIGGEIKMEQPQDSLANPITPPSAEAAPEIRTTEEAVQSAAEVQEWKGLPVRAEGDSVYLLKDGQKRWFSSAEAYASYGFKFGDEVKIDQATLNALPEGDPIR